LVRKQQNAKRLPVYWVADFDTIALERLMELETDFKPTSTSWKASTPTSLFAA